MKLKEVVENCTMRSYITCTLKGNMDQMGMAHSTYGEKIGFPWERQKERDH
jgi:hypothetical protein